MRKTQQSKFASRDVHVYNPNPLEATIKNEMNRHAMSMLDTSQGLSSRHQRSQKSTHNSDFSGISISGSSVSTRNPLQMMRLNKDLNERERIKFMKEKVIRNHIETAKQKMYWEGLDMTECQDDSQTDLRPQLSLQVGKPA